MEYVYILLLVLKIPTHDTAVSFMDYNAADTNLCDNSFSSFHAPIV